MTRTERGKTMSTTIQGPKKTRQRVSTDEGYSRWAREYDDYPNPLIMIEEPIVRALVETSLGATQGRRVLEVACGTGRHTLWLAKMSSAPVITAVEPNREMLAIARAKASELAASSDRGTPSITWLEGEAAHLPVADASFDVVLNALSMEHVPTVEPVLREMHRALAPRGSLVVSVYHPYFLLKGVPTHFASGADGVEYEMPTYVHHAADYLTTLIDLDMKLTHFHEPIVDDALIARRPNMEKHRGLPLAIIFRATRT